VYHHFGLFDMTNYRVLKKYCGHLTFPCWINSSNMDPASGYLTKRDKKLPSDLLHFTAVFIHQKTPPPPWTRPKFDKSISAVADNTTERGKSGAKAPGGPSKEDGERELHPLEDWDCKA
jgi:hypothetical protein